MRKRSTYKISSEVFKYPYCGNPFESEEFLSEKVCCYTIRIRKKIVRKAKRGFVYANLIFAISNGLTPIYAIGLPIIPRTDPVMRLIDSDPAKQLVIAKALHQMPAGINFTKSEMNQLYDIAVEHSTSPLTEKELLTRVSNLRGGSFSLDPERVVGAIAMIGVMILVLHGLNATNAFLIHPRIPIIPDLQWQHGNNPQRHNFPGMNGCGPIPPGMARTANSEYKEPIAGSWDYDYGEVMRALKSNSNKKKFDIGVGNQCYILKNPYQASAEELSFDLAEQMYDSIRDSDTDVSDIAENLGFRGYNIKNVKDHIFYNKHHLDRIPDSVEYKRFDADLQQALAWKRLEAGTHTQNDVTWIKHECVERRYELKHDSGYSAAHDYAQSRFDGAPWDNNF